MNREIVVVLDHLELRVIHADPLALELRLAKNDQSLPCRDHLLHVVQIEPAQGDRLAERVSLRLLQRRFENLLPAAETHHACFRDLATDAERGVAFIARKAGEFAPVFVAPRIVRQQILDRFDFRAGATATRVAAAPNRIPRVAGRAPSIQWRRRRVRPARGPANASRLRIHRTERGRPRPRAASATAHSAPSKKIARAW